MSAVCLSQIPLKMPMRCLVFTTASGIAGTYSRIYCPVNMSVLKENVSALFRGESSCTFAASRDRLLSESNRTCAVVWINNLFELIPFPPRISNPNPNPKTCLLCHAQCLFALLIIVCLLCY